MNHNDAGRVLHIVNLFHSPSPMHAQNCLVIGFYLELNSWTDAGEENVLTLNSVSSSLFTFHFDTRLALNLLSLGPDSHKAGTVFPCHISEYIIHPKRLGRVSLNTYLIWVGRSLTFFPLYFVTSLPSPRDTCRL